MELPFVRVADEAGDFVIVDSELWSREFRAAMATRYDGYEVGIRPGIERECPVCNADLGRPPYDADGVPSYDTCAECGFQFGVTDAVGYDFAERRRRLMRHRKAAQGPTNREPNS